MNQHTPGNIIRTLKKIVNNETISDELAEILERKYEAAKRYQKKQGVQFDLTLNEYIDLIQRPQIQSMEKKLKKGTLKRFMKSDFGYCLTWKDRPSRATKIMNAETAVFVNRQKSKRNQQFVKGDTHTQESKDAISKGKTGQKQSEETKAKISASKTGTKASDETRAKQSAAKKGRKLTDEQKAAIAEGQRARHAARKAAKENGNA